MRRLARGQQGALAVVR